jgi:hypothetical protein
MSRSRILTRARCSAVSVFIAVPLLLFFADWASRLGAYRRATEFLLVPPLAVIIYLLFSQPESAHAKFRSTVILPALGAAAGQICYFYFGFSPWSVAIATFIVLVMQGAIRGNMPPALALAVLAMLLHARGAAYTIGVAVASALVWCIFLAWRQWVWKPLP